MGPVVDLRGVREWGLRTTAICALTLNRPSALANTMCSAELLQTIGISYAEVLRLSAGSLRMAQMV